MTARPRSRAISRRFAACAMPIVPSGAVEYRAGCPTLIDLMKLDVMWPAKVVDLGALAGANDAISVSPDGVASWAMVKISPRRPS